MQVFVSGQLFPYGLPDLFGEASEFPSIQAHGGICRLAHGAALLPSASSKLHSALGYLICLQVKTMDLSQEGMRGKRRSSTSMHQSGINPAADTTHMLCFSSGLSKVVAAHSSATAQRHNWQNFPVLLQVNFSGMNRASLEYKQFM